MKNKRQKLSVLLKLKELQELVPQQQLKLKNQQQKIKRKI
jgi:hypothetical protein